MKFDKYIVTQQQATEAIEEMIGAEVLYVDTEFVRQSTYFPVFSLLQVHNGKVGHIYDMYDGKINATEILQKLFSNSQANIILHDLRQDLELFYSILGYEKTLPGNFFDTQIAGLFVGCANKMSYEKMCEEFCNISLDKKHQFSDWSLRPLSMDKLNYAINDVIYLQPLHAKLLNMLQKAKKKQEYDEEMKRVTDVEIFKPNVKGAFKKLKISKRTLSSYSNEVVSFLNEITSLREEIAVSMNLRRGLVIEDKQIFRLADDINSGKHRDQQNSNFSLNHIKFGNKIGKSEKDKLRFLFLSYL